MPGYPGQPGLKQLSNRSYCLWWQISHNCFIRFWHLPSCIWTVKFITFSEYLRFNALIWITMFVLKVNPEIMSSMSQQDQVLWTSEILKSAWLTCVSLLYKNWRSPIVSESISMLNSSSCWNNNIKNDAFLDSKIHEPIRALTFHRWEKWKKLMLFMYMSQVVCK